jgi:hypothetical protein
MDQTIDELPRHQVADEAMAASVLAGCLTLARRDADDPGNDAVGEALARRLTAEGWRLTRTVQPRPTNDQGDRCP